MADSVMKQKEELERRMDRIIEWVKTCDNKATILLTIDALMLTILLTSDYVLGGMQQIIDSIFDSSKTAFSLCGTLSLSFFLLAIAFSITSIYRCLSVVKAKTDGNTYKLSDKEIYSLIHFDGIDKCKTFEEYSNAVKQLGEDEDMIDIQRQIYANAKRCSEKFRQYNEGVKWLMAAVPFMTLSILCLLLYLM